MATTTYALRGKWEPTADLSGWLLTSASGAVMDAACGEWVPCEAGARLTAGGQLVDATGGPVATVTGVVGRPIQSLGGHARARKMTKRARSESARKAAAARWSKRKGRK
jgi:hypothetical protein